MPRTGPINITIPVNITNQDADEALTRLRRGLAAMGVSSVRRADFENPDHLAFHYTNWRGEHHHYQIEVEGMTFEPHGDADAQQSCWQIHGSVVYRDGSPRPELGNNRRRSFKLGDMTDIANVKPTKTCICQSYHERTGRHAEQCPLYEPQPVCTCAAGHIGLGGGVDPACPIHGANADPLGLDPLG